MKVILIGGECDGKQLELTENIFVIKMPAQGEPHSAIQEYERRTFRGNSRIFMVFALKGMSSDEVIKKLIDNYKP